MTANRPDSAPRRSDQTRAGIIAAFTALVFERGFEGIAVRDVVAAAGTARSTFYEHFASKEDVLRASMMHLFSVIADCVASDTEPPDLVRALDHMWQRRRLADSVFSGQARVVLVRNQADLIEARLRGAAEGSGLLPSRLAAIHLAEAQFALIENWLRGRAHCPVKALAAGLHCSSRAAALALLDPAGKARCTV